MIGIIWKEWLIKIDNHFQQLSRKILLFVENFSAHVNLPVLKDVKVVFFPPNCSSKLQPLDQGIIANFMKIYRSTMLDRIVESIDNKMKIKQIDVK